MSQKLQKLKQKHEIEEHIVAIDEFKNERLKQAFMFLGAVRNTKHLSGVLTSQYMRGIQAIESEKLYLDMGFENFVEFLNSDDSPISKSQYYERIKLLETEGEKTYDVLNEIGIANSTRKLLAAGDYDAIVIDGDTLKIGDQSADLSNARLVRTLIETYVEDLKKVRIESNRTKEKLNRTEQTLNTTQNQITALTKKLNEKDEESFDTKFTDLILQMSNFAQFVEKMPEAERTEKADSSLRNISHQFDFISTAFRLKSKGLKTKLNDDELAELMEA